MKSALYYKQLDEHKAIGPDGLPTIILKKCAEAIAPSIIALINYGLYRGLYLTDWKYANIPPIFKKGKKEEVENFRPVSLLPVISKVQEKCVANRLIEHVSDVLHNCQHGFQAGKTVQHSCYRHFTLWVVPLTREKRLILYFWTLPKLSIRFAV